MGMLFLLVWRVATFPIAFIYSLIFDRPPVGMGAYSICLLVGHSDMGRLEPNTTKTWAIQHEGFFYGRCRRCLKERSYFVKEISE